MSLGDLFHINDFKSQIITQTRTIAVLNEKLCSVQKENEALRKTKEDLMALINSKTAEISANNSANMELQRNLDILHGELEELKEQNSALLTDLANAELKLTEQERVLTDKHRQAINISKLVSQKQSDLENVENYIISKTIVAEELSKSIESLKSEIIELEDKALLQEFGLYVPSYSFINSTEYKAELDKIRQNQISLIKNKKAAKCKAVWLIDGDNKSGNKLIENAIKQIIYTFNVESESIISKAKFNNFEQAKKRLRSTYDKLNSLNESIYVQISSNYLNLKYKELTLAYEYERKKQEEKEYAREQRAIQRENARVQKELEEERQRIEKEQIHFKNQMQRLIEQMETENNIARKELINEKIEAVKSELIDLEKALADVDYRQANERAGYVYVISNIGSFGENIYKIGMTRRLEPMDRIDELGGASVPFRFDVHALIFSTDAPKLETALHNAFAARKVNMVNGRKEFFNVTLEEIENVVKTNYDQTVEFVTTPIAEQYRESIKIRSN